jgi:hypothetical protein
MKSIHERLKVRMQKDRPMATLNIRIPADVVDDLTEIAPMLGVSGSEALARSYIGRGLRQDLERLDGSKMQVLTDSLRKSGVADEAISAAIEEAGLKTA